MNAEVMLILTIKRKKKREGTLLVLLQFVRAVSFKKVNLQESLLQIIVIAWFLVQNDCVGMYLS